jgi:hypothetical protein
MNPPIFEKRESPQSNLGILAIGGILFVVVIAIIYMRKNG